MERKLVIKIFLSFALGITLALLFCKPKKFIETKIDGRMYLLEIADTNVKRSKGLMLRKKLPSDRGMIFTFPSEGKHAFWMYKTLISLKMIWLDKNWNVVDVEEKALPCESANPAMCKTYRSEKPAKYVVEINP